MNLFIFSFGRAQDSSSNHQDTFKVILKQLSAKQEEIDSLRERLDNIKTLPQEIQFLNAALQVG